jgi:hypothetical protein
MLSEYSSSFYDRRCGGNTIKVPHISPKMNGKQWTAVSNIIAMDYYSERYLPNQLSPFFLQFAMSRKDKTNPELLDEYIKFLSDTIFTFYTSYYSFCSHLLNAMSTVFQALIYICGKQAL